jgi:hypothetical protein
VLCWWCWVGWPCGGDEACQRLSIRCYLLARHTKPDDPRVRRWPAICLGIGACRAAVCDQMQSAARLRILPNQTQLPSASSIEQRAASSEHFLDSKIHTHTHTHTTHNTQHTTHHHHRWKLAKKTSSSSSSICGPVQNVSLARRTARATAWQPQPHAPPRRTRRQRRRCRSRSPVLRLRPPATWGVHTDGE